MTEQLAFKADETKHTELSMSRALYQHFVAQNWAPLVHISADPAFKAEADRAVFKSPRIIDMLMVRSARKKGIGPFDLLAVEIKVTRADFFADVRDPAKQESWRTIAHRHAYAVPAGLVRREEVPKGSGLLEVGPGVSWTVRTPYTASPELPASLVLTFAWRAARAEGQLRGLSFSTRNDQDPDVMRAELARLREDVDRSAKRLARVAGERDAWREAYAAAGGGVPCGGCGSPLKPVLRSGHISRWRHAAKQDDAPCHVLRQERAAAAAQARWERMSEQDRARRLTYADGVVERAISDLAPWVDRDPWPADDEEPT